MRRGGRGFTLIELLIALTLAAMVLSLAYSSFRASTGMIERREHEARVLQRAHFILNHITDQLQNVYVDQQAFYRMGPDELPFEGDGERLAFWSQSPPQVRRLGKLGGLQRIAYRLDANDGLDPNMPEGQDLVCQAFGELAANSDVPVAEWRLPVESIAFEYSDGEEWASSWDIESEGLLPRAVRATVRLPMGAGAEPLELAATVPIHVTARLEFEPPETTVTDGAGAGGEAGDGREGQLSGQGAEPTFNPFGEGDPFEGGGGQPPERDPIAEARGNG